jgi:hypothetical protein
MKAIYQALASIALFLMVMNSVITFATTREEATAYDLKSAPTQWRIEVLKDNFFFSKADETELKERVLGFFNQAGTPTYKRLEHYSVCLCIVFIFSVFGYFRERYLAKDRKRAEQNADGNPH